MDLKPLLERAKRGEKLAKPDRLRVLRYLDEHENLSTLQIAELLSISDRQVRRDREEIRRRLREEAETRDLFAELVAAQAWALTQIKRGLRETKPGSTAWWRGVRLAWEIECDFSDRWRARALEERVERLEEALGVGI